MNQGLTIALLAALLAACTSRAPTPTTSGGNTASGTTGDIPNLTGTSGGGANLTGTSGGIPNLTGTTGGSTSGGSGASSSATSGGTTAFSGTTGGGSGTSASSSGGTTGGSLAIGDGGLVATGQLYPVSIALVPGPRLFWANQGLVQQPGAIVELLSDGGTADFAAWDPEFLTYGNGNLYWSEEVPLDAGGSLSLILAAPVDDPGHPVLLVDGGATYGIVVDSSSLYWLDLDPDSANLYIRAFDLDAGTITNVYAEMTNLLPGTIALDSENVYWADVPRHTSSSRVLRIAKDGSGSATLLADNQQYISGIAVESSFVYWLNNSQEPDGGLWRVSADGGTAENLYWADIDPMEGAMSVDSNNVYWGGSNDTFSIPLDGGSVTVLESYLPATVITGITVDSDYVCWTVLRQIGPLVGNVYCLPK